jgi:hypothetical protein
MSKAWELVAEMVGEMNDKLDCTTEGFISEESGCGWMEARPYSDEEKAVEDARPHSKLRNFFRNKEDAFVKKALHISIHTFKEDKYPTLNIQTTFNNVNKGVAIRIMKLDNLRPTMFKVKKLINRVRYELIEHNCLALDKHLAEIIPDRIDDILLGDGKDGETT